MELQFRPGRNWSSILVLLDSCLQICMTYTSAECKWINSWWWAEKLPETYRVARQNKFGKLVHVFGYITKKIIRKLYFRNRNIRFVCVSESQVQQSGICRILWWWSKNTFHCHRQNNDKVWVTDLSELFCYKIIQFWKVIRGLFVGQYMCQVLRIIVRSESSFIAWSMYLELLRINHSYAIC